MQWKDEVTDEVVVDATSKEYVPLRCHRGARWEPRSAQQLEKGPPDGPFLEAVVFPGQRIDLLGRWSYVKLGRVKHDRRFSNNQRRGIEEALGGQCPSLLGGETLHESYSHYSGGTLRKAGAMGVGCCVCVRVPKGKRVTDDQPCNNEEVGSRPRSWWAVMSTRCHICKKVFL